MDNRISDQVIANGSFFMAMFILNQCMVKADGLFPMMIGTWLLYMVILFGLLEWL